MFESYLFLGLFLGFMQISQSLVWDCIFLLTSSSEADVCKVVLHTVLARQLWFVMPMVLGTEPSKKDLSLFLSSQVPQECCA